MMISAGAKKLSFSHMEKEGIGIVFYGKLGKYRQNDGIEGLGGNDHFLPDMQAFCLLCGSDHFYDRIGGKDMYDEYDVRRDDVYDLAGSPEFYADLFFQEYRCRSAL